MKVILIIIAISFSIQLIGQNYIEYQKTINRIDEDIINEEYITAIARLDSIYDNYDFVFARHCFKALQVCCTINDSLNANKWLTKSFTQGIPKWMIQTNKLTKNVFFYATTQTTIEQYDSLYAIYKSSINLELRNKIDSLFEIDQQYTIKVNDGFILFRHTYHGIRWLKNNKHQFHIINKLIHKFGYPGERIIGLSSYIEDSASAVRNFRFYGPILRETKVYFMLIHYYSNPRLDINEILIRNVENGNMPAYQYGALNDFMSRWGRNKYGDYQYYNYWHTDPDTINISEIENRRKSIGLNSYSQQKKNMLIWNERIKNNTANSKIILD